MSISAKEAFDNATYKQAADKIRQLLSVIKNNPATSAKRWVWELMQNAKDIPNKYGKVSVEIELVAENELKFRHNGDPFNISNIIGLIRQVSSKDSLNSDDEITGKFGTGFICTHLLSDIIDISGVLDYKGYRRFVLSLDRSGRSSEELIERIRKVEDVFLEPEKFFEAIPNYEVKRKESDFDTVFTYHLTTLEKLDSAKAGIDDLVNTLPITLVTQAKKIKQVRVIDRVRGTDRTYVCNSVELDNNVTFSEIRINSDIKQFLTYITAEVALTIEVHKTDGGYYLLKRDETQPVLYRDFPLIGSENFFFPYTLNGFKLCPTEKRNSIPLNGEDNEEAIDNRSIINHAVETAVQFNSWLIEHNASNRYLMAYSRRPRPEVTYDDRIALPWITDLQCNWRKILLEQKLLESQSGLYSLKEISVPYFQTDTNPKTTNDLFFNLLDGFYIGRGHLPLPEHHQEWLEVIRSEYSTWGMPLRYCKDDFLNDLSKAGSVASLCAKLNKNEEDVLLWLNRVYKFLVEQNCLKDFDSFALIPNQKGDFKLLKDLRSDHSSRIPLSLKDIYNDVNLNHATIQDLLMDTRIDARVFGNTLMSFSLKDMIEKLNEYVKNGNRISKEGKSIDIKSTVAYELLSLYPNLEDQEYLKKRRLIYNFCLDYRDMSAYSMVDIGDTNLWKETDVYWFQNSFKEIANKTTVSDVATGFFKAPKTVEETLQWLNNYLKFYRDNSNGDLIKEQSVFPNQQLNLLKLSDLRYDNDIAEEFKDLANYTRDETGSNDVYRHQLLHSSIKGYEDQKPLNLEELYKYIKKAFDDSSDDKKEIISRNAISIFAKPESDEPEEKPLYDFAKTLSASNFCEPKFVKKHSGFHWGFAQEFYIRLICHRIAGSNDIKGFKDLSTSLKEMDDGDVVKTVDGLIEFLHSFKNKKFWPIITDKEQGIGIWLNQKNEFCKFQDVRKDDGIPEELKDLAATNRHINRDYREILFSQLSEKAHFLESNPLTLNEIGEFIDGIIRDYGGSKQDNDFRSLIFTVGKLCNSVGGLTSIMKYYNETKNSLIVWSLGEGETMDLVGSLVQQGDEKIKTVKELLEYYSLEELQQLKNGDISERKKDLEDNEENEQEFFEIEVIDCDGNTQIVKSDQMQYAGLSKKEVIAYVSEAKQAVVKYYKEKNDLEGLGMRFDNDRILMDSFSQLNGVYDKDGKELPIVVHSYKSPRSRFFNLNWYDRQTLSKPGAMLWILTSSGLQCLPLFALPIRSFSVPIDSDIPDEKKTALLVLGEVCRQYTDIVYDFGNNMPYGFNDPCLFYTIPHRLEESRDQIQKVCDNCVPRILNVYNLRKELPITDCTTAGHDKVEESDGALSVQKLFEISASRPEVPSIGADFSSIF